MVRKRKELMALNVDDEENEGVRHGRAGLGMDRMDKIGGTDLGRSGWQGRSREMRIWSEAACDDAHV